MSAAFSAIMMVGALVLPLTMDGMTEASTTLEAGDAAHVEPRQSTTLAAIGRPCGRCRPDDRRSSHSCGRSRPAPHHRGRGLRARVRSRGARPAPVPFRDGADELEALRPGSRHPRSSDSALATSLTCALRVRDPRAATTPRDLGRRSQGLMVKPWPSGGGRSWSGTSTGKPWICTSARPSPSRSAKAQDSPTLEVMKAAAAAGNHSAAWRTAFEAAVLPGQADRTAASGNS
jgi:hypothetical protein